MNLKTIFQNLYSEKIIFIILIFFFFGIAISSIFDLKTLKSLIEISLKLVFILGLYGIYEVIGHMNTTKQELTDELKLLKEENKRLTDSNRILSKKVSELIEKNNFLSDQLIRHIGLDLKRDREFLGILKKYDQLKVDGDNYKKVMKHEEDSLKDLIESKKKIN